MKTLKSTIVILFFSVTLFSQTEGDKMAYRAYLTNNKALWEQLVAQERQQYKKTKNKENLYRLLLAQHGLLGATMADKDEKLFNDHYKTAKNNSKELIDANHNTANAMAILTAIYGWEMAYSPYKGMFLGGKSSSTIAEALELDASSPLVWQVYGTSKLFTPETWGGDTKIAQESFEKSVSLYESNKDQLRENWRYLDALALLGQAYEVNGNKEMAQKTYEKALKIAPDFGWVKYALLPALTD
ncbi:tetratricopeptide repeat protein [Maribacter sp. 2307ULW6-5]|uniref:tetratricopeptide repeat protein n=1 Tax=Maribacter sp. 2307ULW6-5 TaxID=3386275 RepID=UPI0039BC9223